MVHDEIVRIAGEESFITPNVIHWAIISPSCVKVLKERGVKCYSSAFRPRLMGGPSAIERAAGCKTNNIANSQIGISYNRAKQLAGDFGFGFEEHYNVIEESSYMDQHLVMYNPHLDMTFFRCNCCCNLVPLDVIPGRLNKALADSETAGNEVFCLASHEQYTFPYYHNYIPDHMERLAKSIEVMVEAGCKPVFFSDGFLGNEVWGK